MHTFIESDETLKARGQYSILRAVHEEKKGELRDVFTVVQSHLNKALHLATGNEPDADAIETEFAAIRKGIADGSLVAFQCNALAWQRQFLRDQLWPKS